MSNYNPETDPIRIDDTWYRWGLEAGREAALAGRLISVDAELDGQAWYDGYMAGYEAARNA